MGNGWVMREASCSYQHHYYCCVIIISKCTFSCSFYTDTPLLISGFSDESPKNRQKPPEIQKPVLEALNPHTLMPTSSPGSSNLNLKGLDPQNFNPKTVTEFCPSQHPANHSRKPPKPLNP